MVLLWSRGWVVRIHSRQVRASAMLVTALVIFGTLGIFVRGINLPSSVLSLARGFMGSAFLLVFMRITGRRVQLPPDTKTRMLLVLSGVFLTLNWTFLFEAYRHTTLPTAELAYEMAPVFVMVASPFVLGESLTRTKLECLALAVCGMALVTGAFDPEAPVGVTAEGIALGLVAAGFYASVMLMGQLLTSVDLYTKTVVQLAVAGIALIPYVLLTTSPSEVMGLDAMGVALLLIVGIVHTGVAFVLWFGSMHDLPAQKVAIMGYIDPIVALLSSAVVLGEALTPVGVIGAVLVLGSMLLNELLS